MIHNSIQELIPLERKTKFLGILLDSNLNPKFHIDIIALKLRHFVPLSTLISIYRSIALPYLSYAELTLSYDLSAAWGQAAKVHFNKSSFLTSNALFFPSSSLALTTSWICSR